MSHTPFNVVIVGCGNISTAYGKTLQAHSAEVRIAGCHDVDPARAQLFARDHGGRAYPSLEAALVDPAIDAIVNLTIHAAHVPVITAALQAGKHVLTEKPLALDPAHAWALVALAKSRNLVLASAPTVALGEAQQTAIRAVRNGTLGPVKIVYGEMNWGRPEVWHPNPAPFYAVGAVFDVGVYPLMIATAALGNITRVQAFDAAPMPERVAKDGTPFRAARPEWTCALLHFASGPLMRLTTAFYNHSKQAGLEFHGDKGSLLLPSNFEYHLPPEVQLWADGNEWKPLPLPRDPHKGCDWGRGVVELASAVRESRQSRTSGEQAAHVVEVIDAIHRSASSGSTPISLSRTFTLPPLMDWAK